MAVEGFLGKLIHIDLDDEGIQSSLRSDALFEFAVIEAVLGFLSAFVFMYRGGDLLAQRLVVAACLAVGGVIVIRRRDERPRTSWMIFLLSVTLAMAIGSWFFPESPSRFLFSAIMVISSLVLATPAMIGFGVLLAAIVAGIGLYHAGTAADFDQVLSPIILLFSLGFVSWLTTRQLTDELSRTKTQDAEMQDMLEQVRDQRARLTRTVNSLDLANRQIEKINAQLEHQSSVLEKRSTQLEAAGQVARDVISLMNVEELLNRTVELISNTFGYYHAAIYLLDEAEEWAVLRAASGEEGQQMLADNHKVPVGFEGMIGHVTANNDILIVPDVSVPSSRFIQNPYLPSTKAEMTFPLRIGRRILGVLDIQAADTDAFSSDDATVFETMADQIALSIQNARLYNQAQSDRAAAQEADRVKTEFLAHMSHELRTPLNAILNFTAFIADGLMGDVNEMQVDTLQKVIGSGNHLLNLINDVLDISKIEAGMMQLFLEEVNLNEILNSAIATARGLSKDTPVVIMDETEPDMPILMGDRRRLRQIMLNLVSNAVKFTQKGEVTIGASCDDSVVHIYVRDTGIGVAPEDLPKVFEAFKQAEHDLENITGTGLGLPITKHFVEAHGGEIWMESDLGKGSVFHVKLPLVMPEQELIHA